MFVIYREISVDSALTKAGATITYRVLNNASEQLMFASPDHTSDFNATGHFHILLYALGIVFLLFIWKFLPMHTFDHYFFFFFIVGFPLLDFMQNIT